MCDSESFTNINFSEKNYYLIDADSIFGHQFSMRIVELDFETLVFDKIMYGLCH